MPARVAAGVGLVYCLSTFANHSIEEVATVGPGARWFQLYVKEGRRASEEAPASLDALEGVVNAVAGRAEVYLDGGVRRGTDVVTALALGARAVFIGLPYVYALAADRQAGVARCVEILETELRLAMTLLGAPTVGRLSRDRVV